MEFDPNNNIVKLCLQGMAMEENNILDEASNLYHQAWNESQNDFDKFLASHFVSRHQSNILNKINWFTICLENK